jgi:methylmalonyl-CoA mutase C-terminal domain/subunit
MDRKIRVVVAKPGLDGHDRGAKVIARAFRDAGMEVIYTGLRQTPEQIVATAIQEDADAIGISILSGAHLYCFKAIIDLLKKQHAADIIVFGGGVIPETDYPALKKYGAGAIFGPGTPTGDTIEWLQNAVDNKRASENNNILKPVKITVKKNLPNKKSKDTNVKKPVRKSASPAKSKSMKPIKKTDVKKKTSTVAKTVRRAGK